MASAYSLKSRRLIGELFTSKAFSLSAYPLRAVYLPAESSQVGFTVPKRRFRRAVDRNLLNRRMREAFRQHNRDEGSKKIAIMFIYIGKEVLPYASIDRAMRKLMGRLETRD